MKMKEMKKDLQTFPITSDVLNININNTGIHPFKLHDIISAIMAGYSDIVTQ